MSIEVKFFASLREQLGVESILIDGSSAATTLDAWKSATGNADYPANTSARSIWSTHNWMTAFMIMMKSPFFHQ